MTVDLPATVVAAPVLVLLFAYAWRLIRRSDAERDRYVHRVEIERDWWRARALGEPEPIPPELELPPAPELDP